MLRWIVQPEDADAEDSFELSANGEPLSKLEYLSLDFKLIDEEAAAFEGKVIINGKTVTERGFEWRPSILRHKVVETIEDDPVK